VQQAGANRRRVAVGDSCDAVPCDAFAGNLHSARGWVAMAPLSSFVDLLTEIEAPRRAEGKLYRPPHVVLFAILALVAGAQLLSEDPQLHRCHIARLREAFGVKWRKAPAYTTKLDPTSVEVRSAAMPPC
jgi:hypothetical protein